MVDMRLARAAPGVHGSHFRYKEQLVDEQKLRRYVKNETRLLRASKSRPDPAGIVSSISLETSKMYLILLV